MAEGDSDKGEGDAPAGRVTGFEGVLDELDDQRRAAENDVSIISDAALAATS